LNNKVRKIRRYLGSNLSQKQLDNLKKRAEELINQQINELKTDIFEFSLSQKEISKLNKYNDKIEIVHLDKKNWAQFTQDFVYNTNAIEGSTVFRDDVPEILRKDKTSNPEENETRGVAEAINFIKETKEDLSLSLLKKLHKLCFKDSKDFAGNFRDVEVVIQNAKGDVVHTGVPVKDLDDALNDLVLWYKKHKFRFKPLILAIIIHNQFEHIHPYKDGNGRVGRLLLNFILIKNKYPPINIYLEDRFEYYKILQKYSRIHDLKSSIDFFVRQYKKTLEKVTTKHKEN
ncbi:MAG: Fic family protein, partial [Nanoarchaeota archaeon]